jgi:hypothetical protein
LGWSCSSMMEHLPNMYKALGSITIMEEKTKKRKEWSIKQWFSNSTVHRMTWSFRSPLAQVCPMKSLGMEPRHYRLKYLSRCFQCASKICAIRHRCQGPRSSPRCFHPKLSSENLQSNAEFQQDVQCLNPVKKMCPPQGGRRPCASPLPPNETKLNGEQLTYNKLNTWSVQS